MKIKTIRLKKNNSFSPEKEREIKGMIIFLALFASGMIVGAGVLRGGASGSLENFIKIFDTYTSSRSEQKIYVTFLNSLAVNLLFLALSFAAGLSCVGLPVATVLPIIKGLGSGLTAGYLFSQFAMSGIGYYLLTIFPGSVIGSSSLLLACNCSSFMSADILAAVLGKKQTDISYIQNYVKKYLILTAFAAAGSAADSVLTKAFAYLFTL